VWTESGYDFLPNGGAFFRYNVADINNDGKVVGYRFSTGPTGDQAVLWKDGRETVLPTAEGATNACMFFPSPTTSACTVGVAINDNDDVVGTEFDIGGTQLATVLWRDGVAEYLDATFALSFPLSPYGFVANFSRISNGGIIAGSVGDAAALLVVAGRVQDAIQQLQEAINLIASYDLTRLGTSLSDKLQLASGYILVGDIGEACGVLTGFLNQVRAQSGKALTVDQATELTMRVNRIRNVIGC
jgi:hypothetical protein